MARWSKWISLGETSVVNITRVLAPNPGPFTLTGTNTWIMGSSDGVVVIDPGPIDRSHMAAIVEAVGDRSVSGILVTHTHPDHAPLANPLSRELSAPTLGYGPGPQFEPDRLLTDGDAVDFGKDRLTVIYTPGHSADHLCFLVGKVLFTGDHIIGGSSVMVEDLSSYMASLARLQDFDLARLLPGHGEEMDRPGEIIDWYLAHRRQREEEILAAIVSGASTVEDILAIVYRDVDRSLHPLAARSIAAHLEKLSKDRKVSWQGGVIGPYTPNA